MTKQTEALKLALEAMERFGEEGTAERYIKAKAAIKEALANHIEDNLTMVAQPEHDPYDEVFIAYGFPKPEQEPVAWIVGDDLTIRADWVEGLNWKGSWVDVGRAIPNQWTPVLYTTPPQRKPLTDEEAMANFLNTDVETYRKFKTWEAARGIKE